uniref:NADH-ubiquinone oxidoreductase chain 4L n=1 Tax=Xibalbanus tulumensis TaxID=1519145 RepID=Q6SKY3_XIBTU|nr:NADH dehydrogenase subunit 4L [Xibalbanus tulumensis]AAS00890.1 NADH dehydrogenase subunit 4L [Xibalbanus tulumensis]
MFISYLFSVILYITFFTGLLGFIIKRSHLMSVLVMLEFMVLGLYLLLMFTYTLGDFGVCCSVMFLVMSVCGGVMGLSIVVCMVRSHGSDSYLISSLLYC